jgi:hypothetical protein
MMFDTYGILPTAVGRLTLPQLRMLLDEEKGKRRKISLAEARAMGLIG